MMLKYYCLLLLTGALCGCGDNVEDRFPKINVPQAVLADLHQQQQGAKLFSRHCRECHGSVGEGKKLRAADFSPPAPDFLNPAYSATDPAYLFWRIKEGKMIEPFYSRGSVMPAFGPYFSEQQIWQLVAYLRHRAAKQR